MLNLELIADTCAALSVQSYTALLAGFLTDESASVSGLLASLESGGSTEERVKAAHRLKGAAASLGLRELADTARDIETGAPQLTEETALLAANRVRTQFDAARDIAGRMGWFDA